MSLEGWIKAPIASVADIIMGQSPDSQYYSDEEIGLPFLQGCSEFTNKYPVPSLYCSQPKKIAPSSSILFSVRAPVGKTNIADQDYIIGRGLAAIISNNISQDYLYHYLIYLESRFHDVSQGSTFEAINSKELSDWLISFPEVFEEQEKIAEVLSTVDRAIAQTEALIAKQQRIKTGLMQDLLTKGIDEAGNIRSEETHEFKDSPLGRIPVEWEVEKFQNRVKHSAFGPRFPSTKYSQQGNFAVLRTTDLDLEGNVNYDQMPQADLSYLDFKEHLLEEGDLLITRSGTCGIPVVFKNCGIFTIPGAFLIRFRLFKEFVDPEYVRIYFNWEVGRNRLLNIAEGGVQKNLRGSTINQILFAFPHIEEQDRIIKVFNSIQIEITSATKQLEKFKQIKTGLMQDLLNGKVPVTPLVKN